MFSSIVFYRLSTSTGTTDFIPQLVSKVTKMFLKQLPNAVYKELHMSISDALVAYHPSIVNLLTRRQISEQKTALHQEVALREAALVCAISLENLTLTQSLLDQGTSVWCSSSIGEPLDRAIATGNDKVLDMLLRYGTKLGPDPREKSRRVKSVKAGIMFALEGGTCDGIDMAKTTALWYMSNGNTFPTVSNGILVEQAVKHYATDFINVFDAKLTRKAARKLRKRAVLVAIDYHAEVQTSRSHDQILELYRELIHMYGKLDKAQHQELFHQAIKLDSVDIVKVLLDVSLTKKQVQQHVNIVLERLTFGIVPPEILTVCVDKGVINLGAKYLFKDYNAPFLYHCVKSKQTELVRVILGHEDAGRIGYIAQDNILQLAVVNNMGPIVKLLLEAEFDPEAICGEKDKSLWELGEEGSQVRDMIHKATLDKIHDWEVAGEPWEGISRSVWQVSTQKHIRIRYTFFPTEGEDMFNRDRVAELDALQ